MAFIPVSADFDEIRRVRRILLAGWDWKGPVTFSGKGGAEGFQKWGRGEFIGRQAPHLLACAGLARSGDSAALIKADAALLDAGRSIAAGRALLAARCGARHLPTLKALGTAVADGKAQGHMMTVLGICAAEFSIAALPLLQAAVFMEWRAALPAVPESFFMTEAGPVMALLPALAFPQKPVLIPLAAPRPGILRRE